jgi:hypothetical protein
LSSSYKFISGFSWGKFKAAQTVNKYGNQRFFPMLTSLHFHNIVSKFNPALPLLASLLKINLNTIFSFTPTFPKPFLSLNPSDENAVMHTTGVFDEINKTILS